MLFKPVALVDLINVHITLTFALMKKENTFFNLSFKLNLIVSDNEVFSFVLEIKLSKHITEEDFGFVTKTSGQS